MAMTVTVKGAETQRVIHSGSGKKWIRGHVSRVRPVCVFCGEANDRITVCKSGVSHGKLTPEGHLLQVSQGKEVEGDEHRAREREAGPASENLQGVCEAALSRGSHSGRWASGGPGPTGLAPSPAGLEVPAPIRQPACQLGKLN